MCSPILTVIMRKGSGTWVCKKQRVEVSHEVSILINIVSKFSSIRVYY